MTAGAQWGDAIVYNASICCEGCSPSKQENNYNKKNMEIFGYDIILSKCYKLRQMFASSLKNPWHNLATLKDIQIRFSAGWKVNKEV